MTLLAVRDEESGILTMMVGDKPHSQLPRFKEFGGGIGWLEPTEADAYAYHWLVVVGRQEDDRYMIFAEEKGDLRAMGRAATNYKDLCLMKRIWLDDTDEAATRFLRDKRQCDGLTGYHSIGKDHFGRRVYAHPPETWQFFRDRDTKASLVPVEVETRGSISSGFDVIRKLRTEGQLLIGDAEKTQECARVLRENPPYNKVFKHPTLKALVFALTGMERTKPQNRPKAVDPEPLYGNLRK